MRRLFLLGIIVLFAAMCVTGCITTSGSSKSSSGSTTTKSVKSDTGLYSQVPASMRAEVKEAQFDMKKASDELTLAEEKVKLAELEKERAILNNEYAELKKKRAEIVQEKSVLVVELKKAEAIDNSGLGDKEDNIKEITKLKTKEMEAEIDKVQTDGDIQTVALKLKRLDKEIAQQKAKVRSADKSKKSSSVAKSKKKRSKKRSKK